MGERPNVSRHAGSLDDDRMRTAPAPLSRWEFHLPVAFILASLIALFVFPILIHSQIDRLRRVIETRIDPARHTLAALQVTFAREGTAIRTYLLTRSPDTYRLYQQLRAQDARQLANLEALALAGLDTVIHRQIRQLRDRATAWHAVHEMILQGPMTPGRAQNVLPPSQHLFENVMTATQTLETELERRVHVVVTQIEAAERLGAILTVGLALMAFVAALTALRIQQRLRSLTRDLHRRAREEKALRRAAEALSTPRTIDDVLVEIASSALLATGADGAFVERIDPATNTLRIVSAAGEYAPLLHGEGPLAGSYTERALAAGRPIRLRKLGRAEHGLPAEVVERCDGCDIVAVPLSAAGEAFGALYVLRLAGRRPFDRSEIARVGIFGNLASLAFRNARALSESEAARHDLERVMESRARLIRGFSHDLKNPLGAADGFLELLETGVKGELNPEQREGLARSRHSIHTALDLIRELVELARAEAGEIRLAVAPLDVRDLVRTITDEYRAQAEAADLDLVAETEETLPIVSSDRTRVAQILGNLISNALKYTPAGGRVTVRARRATTGPPGVRPEGAAEGWVRIDVSDTGPGIPEEQQASIFEEFTRFAPDISQGAGLGLPISRRLARALHGEVTVESEVGRGSTFTLWLPVTMKEERAEAA
jgi:signal transduction histidine kinase/CHASE3 domain sensor protein